MHSQFLLQQRLRVLPCLLLLVANLSWAASIKVTIDGVPESVKSNIRLYFERWEKLPTDNSTALKQRIEQTVLKSMQPLGYYQPEINYSIEGQKLNLSINPGPAVHWSKITVTLNSTPETLPKVLEKALNNYPMVAGERIDHSLYDNYKKELLSNFQKLGYLDAQWITNRLEVDITQQEANVVLILEAGRRYTIEEVIIEGSELWPRTINAMVDLHAGDWYDADAIAQLYDSLLGSGYFEYANVEIDRQPPDQAVLNVKLTERPTDHFSTGIGYGTDTGPRAKFGWTRPQVNDRGDSLQTNLQVSSISKELSSQYRIPWPHPLERYLSWDTGVRQETTTDRESTLLSTGLSFNRVKPQQWQYNYGVNLEDETYRQGDNAKEQVTYLMPNYHALKRTKITSNGDILARGKYWFDTLFGFSFLEDNTRFLSMTVGANFDFMITPNHSIIPRFEFGAIATDEIESVPLSKRFYTGGDQTVRGFKYNSLAPKDEEQQLIGGQFLNVFSLEYQYQLFKNWRAATFVDTGRTYISSHDPFHTGAGFGLRWQLPLGKIAFDLARPITNEEEDGDKWRIHIYMSALL